MGFKKIVSSVKEKAKEVSYSDTYQNMMKNIKDDEYYPIKSKIMQKIEAYDTIIIHRHYRVDGDALGSSLGLREILRTSFPSKQIYSVGGEVPSYLNFLGKEDEIIDTVYENALVIVLDTATTDRIQDQRFNLGKEIIKIDHHIVVEDYGLINYVRENMPATALVIYDWYKTFENKLKINDKAALSLYTAIITDTGRFRYRSVDSLTLNYAAEILDVGVDTDKLYANLYTKDASALKLQGYLFENFEISPAGVAHIYISEKTVKKYDATIDEASNLVNYLDSIKGSLIWILFLEMPNEIRVRLRSRFVGVVDIASNYRGGGHEYAAGATVYTKDEIKKVVKEADEKLKAFKLLHKDLF